MSKERLYWTGRDSIDINSDKEAGIRKYEVTLVIAAPQDESPRAWDWEGLIGDNIYSVNISEKEWS